MTAFAPLLGLLEEVPDHRRAEGKIYRLAHVLLFSILAIVSGGNSYRSIVTFIETHRHRLNEVFGLTWRRAPAHTAVRYILQGLMRFETTQDNFIDAFLRPPLYALRYAQGNGTLYTAAYWPQRRSVSYIWPTLEWRLGFGDFTAGTKRILYPLAA